MLKNFIFFAGITLSLQVASNEPKKNMEPRLEFIWNFGLISKCDKGLPINPFKNFQYLQFFNKQAYTDIQKGDLVWVKCQYINIFAKQVLPFVENPFILLIADGDASFPTNTGMQTWQEVYDFVKSDKLIHIFAQNCDFPGSHPKISHIPVGIDFHTLAYTESQSSWGSKALPQQQEDELNHILKTLKPTNQRIPKAFVDFQLKDHMHGTYNRYLQFGEDRASIFKYLQSTGLIDYSSRMTRADLWKIKGQYAFSISPHGNGLDCHRTWEDLVLGCIVIVKSSSLDPLYKGLPVVIVKDWAEITKINFEKWLALYGDAFINPTYREKLTHKYWFNQILAYKIKATQT